MFGNCFEIKIFKNKIKKRRKTKNKIQRTTSLLFLKTKGSEAVPEADEK